MEVSGFVFLPGTDRPLRDSVCRLRGGDDPI